MDPGFPFLATICMCLREAVFRPALLGTRRFGTLCVLTILTHSVKYTLNESGYI